MEKELSTNVNLQRSINTDNLTININTINEIENRNILSTNKTTVLEENEIDSFYFYQTEQFTFLWIILIIIVFGNLLVLIALNLGKSNKSRMNYFIKHLAMADLLVGLVNVLTDIIWRITISWYAGNIMCKLIRFLQVVVTYSSTYVLVALSIDRYDAIRHPMNFSGSWKRAKCLVSSAWLISFIFSSPILIFYEENIIQEQVQCWIEFSEQWHWQLYMTLVAVTLFIIPTLIITSCYAIIVATIWTKGKILVPKTKRKKGSFNDSDCRRVSSRGLIPRAKIKTIKMTFVIVFVFIICWSPYIVFDLLQVYGHIPKTQTNIAIATFIQSLTPLNSAANPIIYCAFSSHICQNLRTKPPFKWLMVSFQSTNDMQIHSDTRNRSNTRTTSMSEILTLNPRKKTTTYNHHSSIIDNNHRMTANHCQILLTTVTKINNI